MVIKFKNFEIKSLNTTHGYQLTVERMGESRKNKEPKMQYDVSYPGSIETAFNSALKQLSENTFTEDEEITIQEYLNTVKKFSQEIKEELQEIKKQLEAEKICL